MPTDYERFRDRLVPRLPESISDSIGIRVLGFLTWLEETKSTDIDEYHVKEELIEEVFLNRFHYHPKWPILVILISVTWVGADALFWNVNLQKYGLFLDAAGGGLLSLSIVRGKAGFGRDTSDTKASVDDGNHGGLDPTELKANVADTILGLTGAFFLIIGFLIQIIWIWFY